MKIRHMKSVKEHEVVHLDIELNDGTILCVDFDEDECTYQEFNNGNGSKTHTIEWVG